MKVLKMLPIATVTAMSSLAFIAGSASATTLEVGGAAQNGAVFITASLTPKTTLTLSRTDGSLAHTCTESHLEATTEAPFTVADPGEITGKVNTLSFTNCDRPVTVHKPGVLHISRDPNTATHGTVTLSETEITTSTVFGTVTCKTGSGVDFGTLTGATTAQNPGKHAEIDVNAILGCGFLVPSASLKGTYIVTTPTELGVIA